MIKYDLICEIEAAQVNKRFLPYALGTPTRSVSYDDQYARVNLIFFSDSHLGFAEKVSGSGYDNVKRTIEFANESPVPFDAIVHTGDIITPFGRHPRQQSIAEATPFFGEAKKSKYPFVFSKGNHDLNDWFNTPDQVFNEKDWGGLFLDYAEEKYGIVRQLKANGEKSTWHYLDIPEKKIRIISVDSQDTDKASVIEPGQEYAGTCKFHGGVSPYVSNEQINWIASTALNFDDKEEKDWGVILALHMVRTPITDIHEDSLEKLFALCEAFKDGGKYSNAYKNEQYPFFNWDVDADFTRYAFLEKKPHIICALVGHDHEDKNEVYHGINLIWTLNGSATSVCGDARVVRIPGTSTQNSFDIVNIDTRERRIRIFKYGAGKNCYGIGGDRFLPDGLPY